jgi:hypothetical protein
MLSISVIVFFSVVLFLSWLRYSCLLILQAGAAYPAMRAAAAGLSFPSVQQQLRSGQATRDFLDQLHRDLSNDYRILCFLLRCSPETGVDPMERRLLVLDYWMMQAWYSLTRRTALPQARKALEEISCIVNYFACSVGRHAA